MDPKQILLAQRQADLNAALKSGKTGTNLLDDSDNNIGTSQTLEPVILPFGSGQLTYSSQPSSNKNWLLNLRAGSKSGQSITVVMTAARKEGAIGYVGPITGVIEFGNGSTSTTIEFDIPVGPFAGSNAQVQPATQPQDSGAVIQVPSSIIRAYARYDNALLQPLLEVGSPVFGQPGFPFAIPAASGPFSPNSTSNDPLSPFPSRPIAPVLIKAFASYFGRHYSRLYKTQYLFVGNTTAPVLFAGAYAIPPFAKSVRVVRTPETSVMSLGILDGLTHPNDTFATNPPTFNEVHTIAAGPAPTLTLDGQSNIILLSSAGANTVSGVKLVYEIGF